MLQLFSLYIPMDLLADSSRFLLMQLNVELPAKQSTVAEQLHDTLV